MPDKGNVLCAQSLVDKPTASTGKQAAASGRKISCAEAALPASGQWQSERIKGRPLEWIPRHRSPKNTRSQLCVKERGTRWRPADLPWCPSSQEREGRHGGLNGCSTLGRSPRRVQTGKLDSEIHSLGPSQSGPAISTEVAPRRRSPGDVSGGLSGT
jgi:hypothetical protein